MAQAKMNSGWKGQSLRHSNAKRFGRAGGKYASSELFVSSNPLEVAKHIDEDNHVDSNGMLPIYQIKNKLYFRDKRLGEYRNLNDPNDKIELFEGDQNVEKPTIKVEDYMKNRNIYPNLPKHKQEELKEELKKMKEFLGSDEADERQKADDYFYKKHERELTSKEKREKQSKIKSKKIIQIDKNQLESSRKFWSKIAKKNNWYKEPFFVIVWVDKKGNVTDSLSHIGLKKDFIVKNK